MPAFVNQWRIFAFHHMCFVQRHAFPLHFSPVCLQSILIQSGRFHVPLPDRLFSLLGKTMLLDQTPEEAECLTTCSSCILSPANDLAQSNIQGMPIFRVLLACWLLDQINIGFHAAKHFLLLTTTCSPRNPRRGGEEAWRGSKRGGRNRTREWS